MEPMEPEFEVGCIVHLNTGSPDLIVTGIYAGGITEVVWFDMDGCFQREELPFECIHLADYCDAVPDAPGEQVAN